MCPPEIGRHVIQFFGRRTYAFQQKWAHRVSTTQQFRLESLSALRIIFRPFALNVCSTKRITLLDKLFGIRAHSTKLESNNEIYQVHSIFERAAWSTDWLGLNVIESFGKF